MTAHAEFMILNRHIFPLATLSAILGTMKSTKAIRTALSCLILTVLTTQHALALDPRAEPESAGQTEVKKSFVATKHLVVAANPYATGVGLEILRKAAGQSMPPLLYRWSSTLSNRNLRELAGVPFCSIGKINSKNSPALMVAKQLLLPPNQRALSKAASR